MHVQRWILSNSLKGLSFHDSAFAYRRQLSIKHCAQAHLGARWLLKMDLHNFFGSIEESRVYGVFRRLGYPSLLAFEMARICTKTVHSAEVPPWLLGRGIEAYGSPDRGVLPQGAPTSGALANAIAYKLDTMLSSIANDSRLEYTRYSDDLTFSSSDSFSRTEVSKLVLNVERAISLAGFDVHKGKTRTITPGSRQIVLGLMLTPDAVRLVPEFRHKIDNFIRCVERYGLNGHAKEKNFDSVLSMINYVDGCLAFAIDIERDWAIQRRLRWRLVLSRQGHPVSYDTKI